MEYRTVPRSGQKVSVIGLGMGSIHAADTREVEETVRLVHERAPEARVFVGGAVLTPEYAAQIGADFYGKDAAEAARIAERFFAKREDGRGDRGDV